MRRKLAAKQIRGGAITLGLAAGLAPLIAWVVLFPILKALVGRSGGGRRSWSRRGGWGGPFWGGGFGGWGGGLGGGRGGFGGGGFSGGGGRFGGGGASGSW